MSKDINLVYKKTWSYVFPGHSVCSCKRINLRKGVDLKALLENINYCVKCYKPIQLFSLLHLQWIKVILFEQHYNAVINNDMFKNISNI